MTFQKKSEFTWIGINKDGNKTSGKLLSETKITACNTLENNGITVLFIKKINPFFSFSLAKKLTQKDMLDFTQQLLLLLEAGIPLVNALTLIANTSSHCVYRNMLNVIIEKIISGVQFSNALSDFPAYFNKTYCKMIAAGEQSSQLETVLAALAKNQESRLTMRGKIIKALLYPVSVIFVALGVTIGLLVFVIPQFRALYDNFGAKLPLMTRYLITISHYLTQHGLWIILATFFFLISTHIVFRKSSHLNNIIFDFIFKIPIFRSVIITEQIARWSQLLAMTLSSGIPLIEALQITNRAISPPLLQKQLQQVREYVITGQSLHTALNVCRFFPERAKTMIAIGENADALSIMMQKMAIFYQHQLNETLDRLSKLLEPVIMMAVASLVSGLIIAMYLPIFRMGNII